jgi:sec-independent protein translocase protein TatA
MFTLPRGAELIIILFLAILLFGRGRIGNIFKELGKGLKDFRDAVKGENKNSDEENEQGPTPE